MKERLQKIVDEIKTLSLDDRVEVLHEFCWYCGDDDPRCQCWNDE